MAQTLFDFSVQSADGKTVKLSEYKGQAILIVNVASKCGFTPQYEGLQALYEEYHAKGLMILGFPCNQFGSQEPGTEAEIQGFCSMNYGVKFPVMAKINVNGDKADPLYQWLKESAPGLLGSELIKWNFTKFLLNREGQVVERYAPITKPEALKADIEKILG